MTNVDGEKYTFFKYYLQFFGECYFLFFSKQQIWTHRVLVPCPSIQIAGLVGLNTFYPPMWGSIWQNIKDGESPLGLNNNNNLVFLSLSSPLHYRTLIYACLFLYTELVTRDLLLYPMDFPCVVVVV